MPPPVPPIRRSPHHSQLLDRAALALQMQQFGEAERLAAEVLKASRADTAAAMILARALMAQNRGSEAIGPLEKAARRTGDPGIETLLGAALGGAGRRREAIELLRRTTAQRPPFMPAFQELAGQLQQAGQLGEAIAAIESALALAPDSVDLQLDLGRLLLDRNARGRARATLARAHETAPGRTDVLTTLARVLALSGDYAAAADAYRRALALRPDDAMTRADLATCLLEMGEREAGEAGLRAALKGRPQIFGRTAAALVNSSHGRFFFRQSAAARFLKGEAG